MLGKHVDLIIYNFGEYPRLHQNWVSCNFKDEKNTYKTKLFGKGAISFKTQINPTMLYHLVKDKPDIVIGVAFWIQSLYASTIKNFLAYKFIITTDAIFATEKNISSIRKIIRKFICWNTNAVISASQLTTEYLEFLCPNTPVFKSLQTTNINEWNDELMQLPEKILYERSLTYHKIRIFCWV